MEKLIEIQSAIQMIERLTLTDSKYFSVFNYVDERTLKIESYCKGQAIKWFSILERIEDGYVDIENCKLTIHYYGEI